MLTRYWFVLCPESRFGTLNAGVTAYSVEDAKALVIKNFDAVYYHASIQKLKEGEIEIIENIDIRLLDAGHVLPNIGPVAFRGVWFPRLNLHEEL